ncbi:branched-chain amino acid aminotransferase [Chryseolinea lacunae]|uniref:branched-chain-amino-acid transaminase n=1 Tax=Chryseolinea lacunae TaxID=2801331 RepID=A0ABS1L0L2_9BACT|nr:branched-chain amino acid aminotransferase [Chryseolinea lacunae]MBL0745058.1 branched-chain amino acid aminotransferase [Chryseolinea lacunae]
MVETLKVEVERVAKSRLPQVDFSNLPFGKICTDHMFMADFRNGAWGNLRIVPFGYMPISPATPALHYGQSVFEGLKAHRGANNEALVFRPMDNWARLNRSAERLCMAQVSEEVYVEGLRALIELDRTWIPGAPGSSLYIRPFLFSADEIIGIRPSQDFTFMIIASPVGAYYAAPVKVKIETHYTRAVAGGTGFAKAGGNYGGAIYPTKLANDQGYQQLLWTDGREHANIEESGTMNVMFVIDDTLVTPALSDSILAGITRDSVLTVARSEGMRVEERKVSVKELIEGLQNGRVREAFGVGTAATIAPIEAIGHEGVDYHLPAVEKSSVAPHIYKTLDNLKRGIAPDPFGWITKM